MNLFLVGWNLPRGLRARIPREFERMLEIYPQLDPRTFRCSEVGERAVVATLTTDEAVAAPRRYVHLSPPPPAAPTIAVLYDGSLVDRRGGFTALDAQALARHWDDLPDRLVGQFVLARATAEPPRLDIVTDPLGFHQAYVRSAGEGWLASNSVRLLGRLAGTAGIDPVAASHMLALGWVGEDRTLDPAVRVIPGGVRWTWDAAHAGPTASTYAPRTRLAHMPRPRSRQTLIAALAADLVTTCRRFESTYGRLTCPLTAGRDSRVLAALLIAGEIDALYYTSGENGSPDVEIGRGIAARCGLEHEVREQPAGLVIQAWDGATDRLLQQGDGLISLIQVADMAEKSGPVERLQLGLWGIGGEIARGHWSDPRHIALTPSPADIESYLTRFLVGHHGGLLTPAAVAHVRAYVTDFVAHSLADGFRPIDVPDVFYAEERARRWGGSNERKAMTRGDRFTPFVSRAFIDAAFSFSARERMTEPLHVGLIRHLAPPLYDLPLAKAPWRSQVPALHFLRWAWQQAPPPLARLRGPAPAATATSGVRAFEHAVWLEAKLGWIRELCLEQHDARLWDLVDRATFERVTAPGSNPAVRRDAVRGLYHVATVFAWNAALTADRTLPNAALTADRTLLRAPEHPGENGPDSAARRAAAGWS